MNQKMSKRAFANSFKAKSKPKSKWTLERGRKVTWKKQRAQRRPVQDVGAYTGGTGGACSEKGLSQGHLLMGNLFYHIIHRLVDHLIDLIRNGLYHKLLYQEGGYRFRVKVHRNSLLLDELIDSLLQHRQGSRIVRHKRRHDLTRGMGIELVQKRFTLNPHVSKYHWTRALPRTRQRKQEKANPHLLLPIENSLSFN